MGVDISSTKYGEFPESNKDFHSYIIYLIRKYELDDNLLNEPLREEGDSSYNYTNEGAAILLELTKKEIDLYTTPLRLKLWGNRTVGLSFLEVVVDFLEGGEFLLCF